MALLNCTAIVNTSNESLTDKNPVSESIFMLAGPDLKEDLQKLKGDCTLLGVLSLREYFDVFYHEEECRVFLEKTAYKADFLLLKPVAFAVPTVHEKPGPQTSLAVQFISHTMNLKMTSMLASFISLIQTSHLRGGNFKYEMSS